LSEQKKVSRRRYLKYAAGVAVAAGVAGTGTAIWLTTRPAPAITKTATVTLPETSEVVTVVTTVSPQERKLEIFDWWTADYEKEAANAMFKTLTTLYPDMVVVENPTIGTKEASPQAVLQARLAAGLPPDTWQMTAGAELKAYVDKGRIQTIDDVWDGLKYSDLIPRPLADMVTLQDHKWGIPLNIHFQNVLYYDQKLFGESGLAPPTNFEELMKVGDAARRALTSTESAPIALGTKDKFEAGILFDAIFLDIAGPEHYVDFYKGLLDPKTDPALKTALMRLSALVSNVYSDHTGLTSKQSCDLLISGRAAMVIAGTDAISYFISKGWVPGKDFGAVVFPQKPQNVMLGHSISYGCATDAPHLKTCEDWLKATASSDLQKSTIVKEGGLFARLDISPEEFPDPIRGQLQAYLRDNPDKLILDQFGGIAPHDFSQPYWDAIIQFLGESRYAWSPQATDRSINRFLANLAPLFETYNVKQEAAWYHWGS
jgi:glucose/mannose transport system substrate-binding protein